MESFNLVADGIVQLLVDDVPEGGNLRKIGHQGIQEGDSLGGILVGEAQDEHHRAGFRRPDEHVAEIPLIVADIVEIVPVFDTELLDKQADSIGRLWLEPAFLDIQDLVEEFAHVEAQAHPVIRRYGIRIFAMKHPAFAGSAEFQLVTVKLRPLGGECRPDFRDL